MLTCVLNVSPKWLCVSIKFQRQIITAFLVILILFIPHNFLVPLFKL